MIREEIISKIRVLPDISIKEALKAIDKAAWRILFVCDENGRLKGSLTDGDIRRRILQKGDLQEKISICFNRQPISIMKDSMDTNELKKLMLEKVVDVLPVVDEQNRIVDLIRWEDVFKENKTAEQVIDIPVVVMAGGKGERFDPFTKILPKPLIPIGDKPMIEVIMDKFIEHGVRHFYLTLNYKGEMVKLYFDGMHKACRIDFIMEDEFLGTAGSLVLLPDSLKDSFIVSNCDIIVDVDYVDLIRFHKKNNNVVTVVGSIQHHRIPYGIIEFEKGGKISDVQEKPEYDFTVNTGVYVLSKSALGFIPHNKHFDMTDLIHLLTKQGLNVGVYPVSQRSYIDIGQWEYYRKHTSKLV